MSEEGSLVISQSIVCSHHNTLVLLVICKSYENTTCSCFGTSNYHAEVPYPEDFFGNREHPPSVL